MGKTRGMYFRDRKSISEIARLTSLSRNTIKRWLRAAPGTQPKYRRSEVTTKLTPFATALTKALETDAHRPRRERRTARALHAQLKAQGYAGGYTRLTDFIRDWRHAEGKTFSTNAFVPLTFGLGEAFQFDWSEEPLVVGASSRRTCRRTGAALAGRRASALWHVCRTQCVARRPVPHLVERDHPPSARGIQCGRDARARAAAPDADDRTL